MLNEYERIDMFRRFALFGGVNSESLPVIMIALDHAQQQAMYKEIMDLKTDDWLDSLLLAVGVVNFITGKAGTGKTNLAMWRLYRAHKEGYICAGNPKVYDAPYYTFIERVSTFNKWLLSHPKKPKYFIYDDVGVGYGGHRTSQSPTNLMLVDFIRICRKEPNKVAVDVIAHKKRYADIMLGEMCNEVWHLPHLLPRIKELGHKPPDNHLSRLEMRDPLDGTLLRWTDTVGKAPLGFDTDHIARWIYDEELHGIREEIIELADRVTGLMKQVGIEVCVAKDLKRQIIFAAMQRLHIPKQYLDRVQGELLLRLAAGEVVGAVPKY